MTEAVDEKAPRINVTTTDSEPAYKTATCAAELDEPKRKQDGDTTGIQVHFGVVSA